MVRPAHRNLAAVTSLVCAVYEYCLTAGITENYIDCNPPLPSVARLFGYTTHKPEVLHPEYGSIVVMRLLLNDVERLQSVRSPFLPIRDAFFNRSTNDLIQEGEEQHK